MKRKRTAKFLGLQGIKQNDQNEMGMTEISRDNWENWDNMDTIIAGYLHHDCTGKLRQRKDPARREFLRQLRVSKRRPTAVNEVG